MSDRDQRLYWEDFAVGHTVEFGAFAVTATDIVAFAREFDPRPEHLDETAARSGPAGGVVASDWHVCAMLMRMMCDDYLCRAAGAGAPGVELVRWFGWVRPDDVLRARRTALEMRASRSRPRIGIVRMLLEVVNQRDEVVMTWLPVQLYDRREPTVSAFQSAVIDPAAAIDRPPRMPIAPPARHLSAAARAFEDVGIGESTALGRHTFTRDDMLGFASRFNPQYFHADEAAAEASIYGGLIASGWHTAAVWNRLAVDNGSAAGPSIAVIDMKWPVPVRPGDTVSYATCVTARSLPRQDLRWGAIESHNKGTNQRGETVLSLTHRYWAPRRESGG